jgi:hypothetical protein
MKITTRGFLAIFAVMILASVVVAQSISTHVIFVVPSVVSLRVILPGYPTGFNNTNAAQNITIDIMFNSSANISSVGTTSILGLNATLRYTPSTKQDDTSGIFNYTNTGNVNINVSLVLDSALPLNCSVTCTAVVNNTIRLYAMNRTPAAAAATAPAQPCMLPGNNLGANATGNCIYINSSATGQSSNGASIILQNFVPGSTNSTYLWADFLNMSVGSYERNITHLGTSP